MTLRVAGGPVRGRGIRRGSGDAYGRVFLADAATGLLASGFTYTRSGPDLWCPQFDGSLASFAANVIPREWANGRWGFRFDPGWTQYITRTHDFSHSTWTKRRATVVPVSIATPDGTGSAYKLVEDTTAANSHYLESEFVNIAATRGCFIVKAGEVTEIGVRYIRDTGVSFGGANARVDLLTGAVTLGTLNVEPLSGGWWKVTGIPDGSATTNVSIRLSLVRGGSETYTGDGVGGVYVLAANATSTAYPVPLTAANGTAGTIGAATCTALLSALGAPLGPEYTVAVDYTTLTTAADKVVMGLSSGAFANSIYVIPRNGSGNQSFSMLSGNVPQLESMSTNAAGVGERQRAVLRAKANDSRAAVNGILAPQDAACVLPVGLTNIRLAGAPWGGPANDFSGHVHGLWLVSSKALTDTQAQDLSRLTLADVGAVSLLERRTKYVRPGLAFSRAAEVYEPQSDGSMVAYSGSQVPWGANGVRLDPAWAQSLKDTNDFTAASWIKTGVQVVDGDTTPGPFGVPVQAWAGSAGSSLKRLRQNLATTTLGPWHARWLIKPGTEDSADFVVQDSTASNGARVTVNLLTGALTSGPTAVGTATLIAATATVLPTGFVDVSIGVNFATALTQIQAIATWDLNGASATTGTLYPACANLTNTAYPVPFTVAQGSAVTVPNPSLQGLLADIGALGDKYTIGVTYIVHGSAAGHVLRIDDGSDNSRSLFYANGAGALSFAVKTAGATVYNQSAAASNGSVIKSAARVESNSTRVANNGLLATASGAMAAPASQSWLRIGRADGGANVPSVTVVDVWYLPTSGLSDAQLQALSTL